MSCPQDDTRHPANATKSQVQVETLDPRAALNDPRVRYLAKACLRRGEPVIEVAQVLGVCADTLHTLLGVEA